MLWGALLIGAAGFYLGRVTAPEPSDLPAPHGRSVPATPEGVEQQSRARTEPADPGPLAERRLAFPVPGIEASAVQDTFDDARGNGDRVHEATDIMADRGKPIVAVDDGVITKLFTSVPGGLTIYQFDPSERWCYYYAHLDRYAPGIKDGVQVRRGQTIAYVGSTGNANPEAPHLHFAIFELGPEKQYWKGRPINPYPMLMRALGR